MSLLSRGQDALIRRQLRAAASGNTVSYIRLDNPTAPIDLTRKCWVGNTLFSRQDPSERGPSVTWGDRDYLVPVQFLSPYEPKIGDRIAEVIGTQLVTFEILPIAGEPSFRFSDPARTVYRLHTKQVKSEPAP